MPDAEVIVVGLGAAGGVVASELVAEGMDVIGIEAGPMPGTHDQDELRNVINARLSNTVHDTPERYRQYDDTGATAGNTGKFNLYGRCVGGSSVHYCGVMWRLLPEHFNMKSEFGELDGANMADWPVDYGDMAPYYERAEQEIGICGPDGGQPTHPDSWSYPMDPVPESRSGELLAGGADELGYEAFPSPQAVLTEQYDGRPSCTYCGHCCFYGCYVRGAKSNSLVAKLSSVINADNFDLRDECLAKRVLVDGEGQVTGVRYVDKADGTEHDITADAVVVSGNSIETPRLLLNSASEHHPDGLANSSGQVGRNLMFHMDYTQIFAKFDEPTKQNRGTWSNKAVDDFILSNRIDEDVDFVTGSNLQLASINAPMLYGGNWKQLYAGGKTPPNTPTWGDGFMEEMGDFENLVWVWAPVEDVPRERNRVRPDPNNRDEWGIPGVDVTFENHPQDFKAQSYVVERCKEIFEAAGASEVWSAGTGVHHRGSSHLMGTCRMGTDPATSVVDSYGRAHDVDNLFVVDGSPFVTSAGYNPTETIYALAFRTAEEIATEWV
ncbi:GMC family oxidoreductase [Haloplanus aerogenes]|uniref:Choline dehydrogenase-like flavoprotein n=1 Tax=Haloplanus aerogenes TaxID=660522 RepID=A0A3M0DX31_9EURY|nr:GMC family oxidoreductase [Haloplanus aerogenes]AZH25694.1 GMC family oxidoreductase [Haloplanus aerogenes]RMB25427.1 choline dehydrogenase-like flavoprotein [Haloplanus aerogenes]